MEESFLTFIYFPEDKLMSGFQTRKHYICDFFLFNLGFKNFKNKCQESRQLCQDCSCFLFYCVVRQGTRP